MILSRCIELILAEIEDRDLVNFDNAKLELLKQQCNLGPFIGDYEECLKRISKASWIKVVPNYVAYYTTVPDMKQHRVVLNTVTVSSIASTIDEIFSTRELDDIIFLHNIAIIDTPVSYIKQITFARIKEDKTIATYW
jgi:hypothetical protein